MRVSWRKRGVSVKAGKVLFPVFVPDAFDFAVPDHTGEFGIGSHNLGVDGYAEVRRGQGRPLLNALRRGDKADPAIDDKRRLSAQSSNERRHDVRKGRDLLVATKEGKASQCVVGIPDIKVDGHGIRPELLHEEADAMDQMPSPLGTPTASC